MQKKQLSDPALTWDAWLLILHTPGCSTRVAEHSILTQSAFDNVFEVDVRKWP